MMRYQLNNQQKVTARNKCHKTLIRAVAYQ